MPSVVSITVKANNATGPTFAQIKLDAAKAGAEAALAFNRAFAAVARGGVAGGGGGGITAAALAAALAGHGGGGGGSGGGGGGGAGAVAATGLLSRAAGGLGGIPGIGGLFSSASSAGPGASGAALGGGAIIAGSLAAFAGQAISGALVTGLGGAFTAMAAIAASKAPAVQQVFVGLSHAASNAFQLIGAPFQAVMESIYKTATNVIYKLQPIFVGVSQTLGPPFQKMADVFIKSFGSPAVKQSISDIAVAFAKMMQAFTPAIPGIISGIAKAISMIADAVGKNPQIFADFGEAIGAIIKYALEALAALTNMAVFLEHTFKPVWQSLVPVFHAVWDIIVGIVKIAFATIAGLLKVFADLVQGHWKQLWTDVKDTIGQVLTIITNTLLGAWNAISKDAIASWNAMLGFFKSIGKQIEDAFKDAGTWLLQVGKNIIGGLWSGAKSVWSDVTGWFGGLAKDILHALGIASPPAWSIQAGKDIMNGIGIGMSQAQAAATKAAHSLASQQAAALKAAGGSTGGIAGLMQKMAAARGWTGAQWNALNNVEMREAGYNMFARNPGSGAYGLAQFINGPGEYAQYGGSAGTAAGQITGMLNYIAQRYGTPGAAWQHELNFGWYDQGGWLPPGLSLAMNKTGAPERVVGPGQGVLQLEVLPGGDSAFEQFMIHAIKYWVRIKGGGNVQTAFGRR